MKFSDTCRGGLLGLALASAALAAGAADLRPLSEAEMAGVYGRGLDDSVRNAFGALTTQEQDNSYASVGDAPSVLSRLSADGATGLDRQLAQQQLQTATAGLQTALKLTQTLATVSKLLAPAMTLVVPFPLLFAVPALPALAAGAGPH